MKKALTILILIIIVGCSTVQRSQRTDVTVTDTSSVMYLPRIVEVNLPRDTAKVSIPIVVEIIRDTIIHDTVIEIREVPVANLPLVTSRDGIVGADAWIRNNKLEIRAYLADSVLYYENDSLLQVISNLTTVHKTDTIEETKIIEKISTIGWIGISIFLATLAVLAIRYFKPFTLKI